MYTAAAAASDKKGERDQGQIPSKSLISNLSELLIPKKCIHERRSKNAKVIYGALKAQIASKGTELGARKALIS